MFLFTKTRNDTSPDYQKLEDIETREPSPSDTEIFYQTNRRGDYRTAFYGLSMVYLITAAIPPFTPNRPLMNQLVPRNQGILFQKADEFEAKSNPKGIVDPWASLIPSMPLPPHPKATLTPPSRERFRRSRRPSLLHLHVPPTPLYSSSPPSPSPPYTNQPNTPQATLKTAFDAGNLKNEHLGHCFDYLRQGVMCAGDMTLEPVLQMGTEEVQVVDGWGVEHRCRSFESMMGFAEGHRYLNTTGIH
ncbi:Oxidase [Lachnellula occidentalis]|uniref:Oxidase n=1 Tax=Lachnellula occidentalis TaxID=215460 RepID=A0A8H8UK73_9HELO|nr:Oxidase [Lachnellula occidentalis]